LKKAKIFNIFKKSKHIQKTIENTGVPPYFRKQIATIPVFLFYSFVSFMACSGLFCENYLSFFYFLPILLYTKWSLHRKNFKIFRFWLVGAAPQDPPGGWGGKTSPGPPLNGRPQLWIKAAKRGRLDQMLFFFGAADATRAARTSGRTSDRTPGVVWLSPV